jgi:hypothetical protein
MALAKVPGNDVFHSVVRWVRFMYFSGNSNLERSEGRKNGN